LEQIREWYLSQRVTLVGGCSMTNLREEIFLALLRNAQNVVIPDSFEPMPLYPQRPRVEDYFTDESDREFASQWMSDGSYDLILPGAEPFIAAMSKWSAELEVLKAELRTKRVARWLWHISAIMWKSKGGAA
jgi:hypothetical protein